MTAPDCPDPGACPVGDPELLTSVRSVAVGPGEVWHNVYPTVHAELFNGSGRGSGRFSPLTTETEHPDRPGEVIPHLYLARNPIGALLESALHGFTAANREVMTTRDLAGRGLRSVTVPERLLLADLRDPELERLGLSRPELVSTSGAHYRCTRRWAHRLRSLKPGGRTLAGIMWHSRVAEIASTVASPTTHALLVPPLTEVCVMYADRVGSAQANVWNAQLSHADLANGPGLGLVLDLVVTQLDGFIT